MIFLSKINDKDRKNVLICTVARGAGWVMAASSSAALPLTRATYCVADVWNGNLTWNSEDPDFTPCFHKTILGEFGMGFE